MLDFKKEQFSTGASAFCSEISPLEAAVASLDRQQRTLTLYLEKPVRCPTHKQAVFLNKILSALSHSALFNGTASLLSPHLTPHPARSGYFNEKEEDSLRLTAALLAQYRICYQFSACFEAVPDKAEVETQLVAFRVQCEAIHERLEEFTRKYKIENRINYWLYQLGQALRGRSREEAVQVEAEVLEAEVLES